MLASIQALQTKLFKGTCLQLLRYLKPDDTNYTFNFKVSNPNENVSK